jgi:hypothetical protein
MRLKDDCELDNLRATLVCHAILLSHRGHVGPYCPKVRVTISICVISRCKQRCSVCASHMPLKSIMGLLWFCPVVANASETTQFG